MRKVLKYLSVIVVAAMLPQAALAADCAALQRAWKQLDASVPKYASRPCDAVTVTINARRLARQFWQQCYADYGISQLQANEKIQDANEAIAALESTRPILGCRK